MSTDIYMFAERKTQTGWHLAEPPTQEFETRIGYATGNGWWEPITVSVPQRYTLFALLADVRNYNDLEPIAPPRGLPADLSPELLAKSQRQDYAHSHSWFLLQELLEFDWNKTTADRTYADWAGSDFIETVLPSLQQYGRPNEVRGIFWFG